MRISLCMIVKDEEKKLLSSLESVKNLVDEVIIVDTGSTDRTKEIALKSGAKVYDFPWINDFSAARNESLKYATGDWILVLDADEVLEEWDEKIKKQLSETNKTAFEIKIKHQKEQTGHHHFAIRLFRNNQEIRYQGRIHEQIYRYAELLNKKEIGNIAISVVHSGYDEETMIEKKKDERNLTMLLMEIKEKPNDQIVHFHLANQYLKMNEDENAIYHYKLATNYKKDGQFLKHSILKMIWALFRLKRYEELFLLIEQGKGMFPDYTDIHYTHGEILEHLGHEEGAKIQYKKCLSMGEPKHAYYSKEGVGSLLPLQRLLSLSYQQFDLVSEWKYINILLPYQRNNREFMKRYYELRIREEEMTGIIREINESYSNNDEIKNYLLSNVEDLKEKKEMMELGENFTEEIHKMIIWNQENEAIQMLLQMKNQDYRFKKIICELCYQCGLHQETIAFSNELLQMNNENFRPINLIMLSGMEIGEKEQIRNLAKEMLKLIPNDEFFQSMTN